MELTVVRVAETTPLGNPQLTSLSADSCLVTAVCNEQELTER